jgi:hypothetical protein
VPAAWELDPARLRRQLFPESRLPGQEKDLPAPPSHRDRDFHTVSTGEALLGGGLYVRPQTGRMGEVADGVNGSIRRHLPRMAEEVAQKQRVPRSGREEQGGVQPTQTAGPVRD